VVVAEPVSIAKWLVAELFGGVGVAGAGGVLVDEAVDADEFDAEFTRVADGVASVAAGGAAAVPNMI
jgi:hypothetical protein